MKLKQILWNFTDAITTWLNVLEYLFHGPDGNVKIVENTTRTSTFWWFTEINRLNDFGLTWATRATVFDQLSRAHDIITGCLWGSWCSVFSFQYFNWLLRVLFLVFCHFSFLCHGIFSLLSTYYTNCLFGIFFLSFISFCRYVWTKESECWNQRWLSHFLLSTSFTSSYSIDCMIL